MYISVYDICVQQFTSDQSSVAQWGGHFFGWHRCLMRGFFLPHLMGGTSLIVRSSIFCWQNTVRVRTPPPHVLLHSLHSPISQLKVSHHAYMISTMHANWDFDINEFVSVLIHCEVPRVGRRYYSSYTNISFDKFYFKQSEMLTYAGDRVEFTVLHPNSPSMKPFPEIASFRVSVNSKKWHFFSIFCPLNT